ncbi:MAG: hypothetical protein IJJ06_06450 [Mogibacterium sp.]|nr:hypothetical protein [Mogibacterium sp.]
MFKLLVILAVIYIVLKVLNTRAKFAEADARREAEEQRLREEAEAEAEDEMIREEAVDVDPEVIENEPEEAVDADAEAEIAE